MNSHDLEHLSYMRAAEAECLLNAGHFAGSYYLMGYAVKCALKAVIAGQQRRLTFPDKAFAAACHTHRLETLLELAGLAPNMQQAIAESAAFNENWNRVKQWNESARYRVKVDSVTARCMAASCLQVPKGVLPWIRKYWIARN